MSDELQATDQRQLLDIALGAIAARLTGLRTPSPATSASPALGRPGASFVTLERGTRLLGCIGTLEPRRPLAADVAANAVAAAFHDPRLPALTDADFEVCSLEVSVLGPTEPLAVASIDELRATLVPGVDGLLVESARHRGTFLPSVWRSLPEPEEFLAQLWRKAGLRAGHWPDDLRAHRYRTHEFADPGPRPRPDHGPVGTSTGHPASEPPHPPTSR